MPVFSQIGRLLPGLQPLLDYRPADWPHDLRAGLSVAAVAIPVAIAYAELAGFSPSTGLYASILPMIVYAFAGTSRQLVIGPDAATCAMIATVVTPLASGNSGLYLSLTIALTLLTGVFCVAASFLRLGGLADFLARPILVGLLNGVSISIMIGQAGKVLGSKPEATRFFRQLVELPQLIIGAHVPTVLLSAGCVVVMLVVPRLSKRVPASLVTMILAGLAAWLLRLDEMGVALIGPVAGGLPDLEWPDLPLHEIGDLAGAAAGLALVLFTSGMLTARSFAERNGYDIDVDREFAAFGLANIASALSQGFAVTGADSRTAVSDANGGRTQMVGIVAAVTISLLLLVGTGSLAWLPIPALGVVLLFASWSLLDMQVFRRYHQVERAALILGAITMFGVLAFGAIKAIVLAVVLALLMFIRRVARPSCEELVNVPGRAGLYARHLFPDAAPIDGLLLLRFCGPLVFFNASHFRSEVHHAIARQKAPVERVVLDLVPMTSIDITGIDTLERLDAELAARGITMTLAGRQIEFERWLETTGHPDESLRQRAYPTMRQAIRQWRGRDEVATAEEVEDERRGE
ncbi:SulP family inorganic anion transporter [Accumulibacter sp.]|uniref:SulP family inorganic anion transporter n=1 Tax=Accumulibacter sp. TaxID=2053492 RepID=UPI0025F2604A|nr:SulP family inorganic anion transporter [Accumulibacter sp.]MCM8594788.1 SulP family inorganic anion transporter [Accumulibacter sp.]MCM8625107.1 SulP family inorganic anion transporter [Accumulibacter sp.]MDS4048933.1 SulP family inorganic anion transporter [Accumulibacter sp.]